MNDETEIYIYNEVQFYNCQVHVKFLLFMLNFSPYPSTFFFFAGFICIVFACDPM